ncbi:MAG TPA: site-2 protease family protein [Longimicrobiaceae bacterium]|nr:site-2 protease family protein [Longimicrobiaceae bacterium]
MTDWVNLFATYRVVIVRDDQVVQGVLHPEIDPGGATLHQALESWPGQHFVQTTPDGTELTLVRRVRSRQPERWWLHTLLFLLTALTTTLAGAAMAGRTPLEFTLLSAGTLRIPLPVAFSPSELLAGLGLSLPLLIILLGHEMGHYLVARRHGMDVSPPFFIPSPHWINLIGTFGAFIRLRSPMINRAMLLDVGIAGPIASFVLSIPAVVVGLALSRTVNHPAVQTPTSIAVLYDGQPIWLGGSLLFDSLRALVVGGEGIVLLHPLAFAGWLGLFVTALNLFPLSQLDGGHIVYALIGRWQRQVGLAFLALLLALGTVWWIWWLWAGLILLLGRGSIRHPSVFDPDFPVTGVRSLLGWLGVVIFVLTFIAIPFRI